MCENITKSFATDMAGEFLKKSDIKLFVKSGKNDLDLP